MSRPLTVKEFNEAVERAIKWMTDGLQNNDYILENIILDALDELMVEEGESMAVSETVTKKQAFNAGYSCGKLDATKYTQQEIEEKLRPLMPLAHKPGTTISIVPNMLTPYHNAIIGVLQSFNIGGEL